MEMIGAEYGVWAERAPAAELSRDVLAVADMNRA